MLAIANSPARWREAHAQFSVIRARNLAATEQRNHALECQYCFEEVIAKTVYNSSGESAPFDADSPRWILKNALYLAEALGINESDVRILWPDEDAHAG